MRSFSPRIDVRVGLNTPNPGVSSELRTTATPAADLSVAFTVYSKVTCVSGPRLPSSCPVYSAHRRPLDPPRSIRSRGLSVVLAPTYRAWAKFTRTWIFSPVEYAPVAGRETIDSPSTYRQRVVNLEYTWAELQPSLAVTFTTASKGFGSAGVWSSSSVASFVLMNRRASFWALMWVCKAESADIGTVEVSWRAAV